MGHQCDEIAHCAAGHEHRRFLAGARDGKSFELAHGRVAVARIVAEARCVHGIEHFGCGLGDGVAAQVDHGSHHTKLTS